MITIQTYGANDALAKGITRLMAEDCLEETSRNGAVRVAPAPVCTVYNRPLDRVLLSETRDANPFFHVMEALWMLAGRNDVESLSFFNARMASYSDDGKTLRGAYGYRWRNHWRNDQITTVIRELKTRPNSRRACISMWDPETERESLLSNGKDLPCNMTVLFGMRDGKLDMTVTNRSNDAIWGCYGANLVHFSFLLEWVAARVGASVGTYYQFSNNLHIYTEVFGADKLADMASESRMASAAPGVPLVTQEELQKQSPENFLLLANDLMSYAANRAVLSTELRAAGEAYGFFRGVVFPMYDAWIAHKLSEREEALVFARSIEDLNWRKACIEWLERRYA